MPSESPCNRKVHAPWRFHYLGALHHRQNIVQETAAATVEELRAGIVTGEHGLTHTGALSNQQTNPDSQVTSMLPIRSVSATVCTVQSSLYSQTTKSKRRTSAHFLCPSITPQTAFAAAAASSAPAPPAASIDTRIRQLTKPFPLSSRHSSPCDDVPSAQ